jgi:predicted pyridoxine 5'-phosphate oxidase superfamily flavin-nucleotide-binding protein
VAILTEDMKRLVREQGLGFYATVCEDGSPNLSPKGTTRVWDDDHLFFAEIPIGKTGVRYRTGGVRGRMVQAGTQPRSGSTHNRVVHAVGP